MGGGGGGSGAWFVALAAPIPLALSTDRHKLLAPSPQPPLLPFPSPQVPSVLVTDAHVVQIRGYQNYDLMPTTHHTTHHTTHQGDSAESGSGPGFSLVTGDPSLHHKLELVLTSLAIMRGA